MYCKITFSCDGWAAGMEQFVTADDLVQVVEYAKDELEQYGENVWESIIKSYDRDELSNIELWFDGSLNYMIENIATAPVGEDIIDVR